MRLGSVGLGLPPVIATLSSSSAMLEREREIWGGFKVGGSRGHGEREDPDPLNKGERL